MLAKQTTPRPHLPHHRGVSLAAASLIVATCTCQAFAQADAETYRVAVLELESDELSDALANQLTQQLRAAEGQRPDTHIHATRVSLSQLSLAQDCNTSEPACLAQIARSLEIDGFVFGKLTHEGGAPVVLLRRYDVRAGAVDRSTLATFSARDATQAELETQAARLTDELLGEPVRPAKPSVSPELPRLELTPQSASKSLVTIQPEPQASGVSGRKIAGFALLGGAALSVGMSVVSFVQVERAEKDKDFERYRLAVGERGGNVKDVCDEASAGKRYGMDAAALRHVKSACNMGLLFEALQFVFIGTAVVSGGLAAYLLSSGGSERRPALGNARFNVTPTFSGKGFGVGARMRF
jgi:hypothetical protein